MQSSMSVSSLVTASPLVAGSEVPRGVGLAVVPVGAVSVAGAALPTVAPPTVSSISDARSKPLQFSYGRLPAP